MVLDFVQNFPGSLEGGCLVFDFVNVLFQCLFGACLLKMCWGRREEGLVLQENVLCECRGLQFRNA